MSLWLAVLYTLLFLVAIVGALGAQFCLKARPNSYELWMIAVWYIMSSSATFGMLFVEGALSRIRLSVFNTILWKTLPSMIFRTRVCIPYLAATLLNDWISGFLAQNWDAEELDGLNDKFPVRGYAMSLLVTGAFACSAVFQNHRMHSLHSVLVELASEKNAFQSLLSMVCDATVWLAADGSCILRCDKRFDMIMGKPMQGVPLVEMVFNPEEEVARLRQVFLQDREAGGYILPPVVLLPTTLHTATGPAAADFFIVHKQSEHQAVAHQLHRNDILVGVRLNEQAGVPSAAPPPSTCCAVQEEGVLCWDPRSKAHSEAEASAPFLSSHSWSGYSAPAVLLGLLHDQESVFASTPHLCAEGGDCLPGTAVAWIDKCSVPRPLHDISTGEQILCYDNLGAKLTYAKVLKVAPAGKKESVNSVKVTLEDGSELSMTADHPVAIQSFEEKLASARTCLLAGDLQANSDKLLVLKMTPTLVTSVEHIESVMVEQCDHQEAVEDSAMHDQNGWITIEVEQPQRHELLVSTPDKHGMAQEMIAVSSCDRKPDPSGGRFLREKNTFLCIPEDQNSFGSLRPHSAPPSLCRYRASPAPAITLASPDPANTSDAKVSDVRYSSDATSTLSSLTDSFGSKESNVEATIVIGQRNRSLEDGGVAVNRLTELVYWKQSGYPSQGSAHAKRDCRPCAFHHTWRRLPDQKPPCKLSYMCEFCHGCSRTSEYRSRYRKQRPPPKRTPIKTSL